MQCVEDSVIIENAIGQFSWTSSDFSKSINHSSWLRGDSSIRNLIFVVEDFVVVMAAGIVGMIGVDREERLGSKVI